MCNDEKFYSIKIIRYEERKRLTQAATSPTLLSSVWSESDFAGIGILTTHVQATICKDISHVLTFRFARNTLTCYTWRIQLNNVARLEVLSVLKVLFPVSNTQSTSTVLQFD
jgi:hypothetical protein